MPKFLLAFALAVSALFFSSTSFAQDSEMGLAKLSAADESRYREILNRTVDPSWLNLKKIQLYKSMFDFYYYNEELLFLGVCSLSLSLSLLCWLETA